MLCHVSIHLSKCTTSMHGLPKAFVQMGVAVDLCAILSHQYSASTIMNHHGDVLVFTALHIDV